MNPRIANYWPSRVSPAKFGAQLGVLASALAMVSVALVGPAQGQTPPTAPASSHKPVIPPVATTIPATGIHMSTQIGAFKIKRGSEALNFGNLEISFKGTVLISSFHGTVVPSAGAELEYSQPQYQKQVYFSKGIGKLSITGQFGGIQFFGQDVDAHYRGDGVIQLFGEFDKNLNTGIYWYDEKPAEKNYWLTNGITVTPRPYKQAEPQAPKIKFKDSTGKG